MADAQIRATNKDAGPPWCILIPGRIFRAFVLLTNAGTSISACQSLKLFPEDRAGAGTLAAPYSSWPSVPWCRISNRHSSCRGCHSLGTHGRNQGTWSIGRLPHARGCGTQPTRSRSYLAEADAACLLQLAGSLRSLPHQSGWRACRTRQVPVCPVLSTQGRSTSNVLGVPVG